MNKFHAVILVDCFDDHFGKTSNFYNAIKLCLKKYEFDNVIFNLQDKDNSIDEKLKNDIFNSHGLQPQIFEVSNMYDLYRLPLWNNDPCGYDILYGGRAWGACLHFGSVGIGKFHSEPMNIYIDPQLVHDESGEFLVTDSLFLDDPVYKFEKVNEDLYKFMYTKPMSDSDMFIRRRIYEDTDC